MKNQPQSEPIYFESQDPVEDIDSLNRIQHEVIKKQHNTKDVISLDIQQNQVLGLLSLQKDIKKVNETPEQLETIDQKLSRIHTQLKLLKQYSHLSHKTKVSAETFGISQEIKALQRDLQQITDSNPYKALTFNQIVQSIDEKGIEIELQVKKNEGDEQIEKKISESIKSTNTISLIGQLEIQLSQIEDTIGIEQFYDNIQTTGTNMLSFAQTLRDQGIKVKFQKLNLMQETIQAAINELKLAEDQLEKSCQLLTDIKSLKEAIKISQNANLFLPQISTLIERCQTLQFIHDETPQISEELEKAERQLTQIQKGGSLDVEDQTKTLRSRVEGAKKFTASIAQQLDSLISDLS